MNLDKSSRNQLFAPKTYSSYSKLSSSHPIQSDHSISSSSKKSKIQSNQACLNRKSKFKIKILIKNFWKKTLSSSNLSINSASSSFQTIRSNQYCNHPIHSPIRSSVSNHPIKNLYSNSQPCKKKVRFSSWSQNHQTLYPNHPSQPQNNYTHNQFNRTPSNELIPVITTTYFTYSPSAYDRSPIVVDKVFNKSLDLPPRSPNHILDHHHQWFNQSNRIIQIDEFENSCKNPQTIITSFHQDQNSNSPEKSTNQSIHSNLDPLVPSVFLPNKNVKAQEDLVLQTSENSTSWFNWTDKLDLPATRSILKLTCQSPTAKGIMGSECSKIEMFKVNHDNHDNSPEIFPLKQIISKATLLSDSRIEKSHMNEDQEHRNLSNNQDGLCGFGKWTRNQILNSCEALDGF
ncbi:hypothetical protein O181_070166 [Austropuccinia psidii MF-1]|uniref:Uncharacterized protein n=1 Tax=Austropuccinia psidii MF-1 TaxID=1389203 RepID=A0A9Q3F4V3_9BASI|nr:hypothetical protein [Austropuccinia psidii MF-1]